MAAEITPASDVERPVREPAIKRMESLLQRKRVSRIGLPSSISLPSGLSLPAGLGQHGEKESTVIIDAVPEANQQVLLGRDRARKREASSVLSRPDARFGIYDSLRHLQSRILASMPEDGHAVIAVCSALEGEGKTTVAVSMAEMLSDQFSRQTLLVDANLNKPQVHSLLETHTSPGLKDCLSIGNVITSAIEWTGRLWVMPAGTDPTVLSENPEDPRELFRLLRSLFRITIVDLPAMSSHESATLMPYWADAVVWVVKADHSPSDVVADSMDLVGRDRIVGVVLNAHKSKLPGWLDRLL